MPTQPIADLTAEQYLAIERDAEFKSEFYGGEMFAMVGAREAHNLLVANIIRDVGDDARRGRIYLPLSDLQQFGVRASDILNSHYSEKFSALMAFEAARARALYAEAIAALPKQDQRAQRPGLMMAAIYYALLAEIEHEQWQVLHQRISLTPVRKLWLAWKNFIGEGASVVRQIKRASRAS